MLSIFFLFFLWTISTISATPILKSSLEKISNEMKSFMNLEVDPCEDFYEFSCGKFAENENIPDDMIGISTVSQMNAKILKQLENVLSEEIKTGDFHTTKLAKQFFKMCMDEEKLENSTAGLINSKFDELAVDGKLEDVLIGLYSWSPYGAFMYFDIFVGINDTDNTKRMIKISSSSLPLPPADILYENSPKLEALRKLYEDISEHFNVDPDEIEDIIELLQNLASDDILEENDGFEDESFLIIPLQEFQEENPYLDWIKFINVMFGNITEIDEDTMVFVENPKDFRKIKEIFLDTDQSTLIQYALYNFISKNLQYLKPELNEIAIKFKTITKGVRKPQKRVSFCAFQTNDLLPFATGKLYAEKYFDAKAKNKIEDIIFNVKSEFKAELMKLNWMDSDTKKEAIEKLNKMSWMIGFAPEILNQTKMDLFHSTLNFENIDQNFFEYMLEVERFLEFTQLKSYLEDVNKTDWKEHSQIAVANAFYNPYGNEIVFPAGILQEPYFSNKYPQHINFGSIGALIGHELVHGFDYFGRYFDSKGNRKEWWDDDTLWEFEDRAFCIIDQYNNFIEPNTNMSVDGIKTLDENIADNGGFKYAYRAYQRWTRSHIDPRLPNFKFNQKQTFWISLAQKYCSVERKEFTETDLKSGHHSPARFRVNGPLSNYKFFAKDFNCKKTDGMMKNDTCTVW